MKIKVNDDFGSGVCSPCAYDTAWVAKIPSRSDPKKPAFPKSVEWLRRNQLIDGSWGSKVMFNAFDRVICTIQTLLALLIWNNPGDADRIKNGCAALKKYMAQAENAPQQQMTAGFELFLPILVDECKKYDLDFDNEYVQRLRIDRERKRTQIKKYKATATTVPGEPLVYSWLYSLEGLGDVYGIGDYQAMICEDGMICSSYSSTAYAIIQDPSLEMSLAKLEKVVNANEGGVPTLAPQDSFAVGYGLTALYMAGIDLSREELNIHLDYLKTFFDHGNGLIGSAFTLEPDGDTNSICLFAMYASKRFSEYEYLDKMIKKLYTGTYFKTYPIEKNATVLTNMHALMALKAYGPSDETKVVIDSVAEWIGSHMSAQDRYPFVDKWTASPFNLMAHFVLAMVDNNDDKALEMVEKIVSLQNSDQGWGTDGISTLEDSASSVLAIFFWMNKVKIENDKCLDAYRTCLEKAKVYFQTTTEENRPKLWICKGLYCVPGLTNAVIWAARYALGLQNE